MSENSSPLKTIRKIWDQTSIPARIAVSAIGVLSIALMFGVGYWSLQPHYVPLANNLDPQQAAEIVNLLDSDGIANKRNFSGSGILVDQNKWNQANSLIANVVEPGQIESNPITSSLLDDPTTRDHRITRDLEFRLEKTIGQLKLVESARVHLGIPEPSPFIRYQSEKTASITIQMRPGATFNRKLSRAIVSLVSRSVEGLDPEHVNLSDTEGNTYVQDDSVSGVVAGQLEYRNQIENELSKKAESLLESALGHGKAVVKVTADIDFTEIALEETRYDPDSKVTESEDITTSTGTRESPLPAAAGTAGNLGAPPTRQKADDVILNNETRNVKFLTPKTVETRTQRPGIIKRLTIAAMVQLSDPATDADEAGPGETPVAKSSLAAEQIENLIKRAVGFDEQRNDQIEVLPVDNLAGETPLLDLMEEPTIVETWSPLVRNASLGIAAVVALLLGFLTLRRIKPVQIATPAENHITPQRARQLSELALLARKNPELLSNIMSAWISDDDETRKDDSPAKPDRKAA